MDNQSLDFELSKRDNVRKFNHKVPNAKYDLNTVFETKNKMNNSSPDILPSVKSFSLNTNSNK